MSIYDKNGARKYLTLSERKRFLEALEGVEEYKRMFLITIYLTGARMSEVLHLQADNIDLSNGCIVFESLKKRKNGVFRAVPAPKDHLNNLDKLICKNGGHLWSFSRRTGVRLVKMVMQKARIEGVQACSKGLRHSFAIAALHENIPLTLIKKWLGHSSLATTEIYLDAIGAEERAFAKRMWPKDT